MLFVRIAGRIIPACQTADLLYQEGLKTKRQREKAPLALWRGKQVGATTHLLYTTALRLSARQDRLSKTLWAMARQLCGKVTIRKAR